MHHNQSNEVDNNPLKMYLDFQPQLSFLGYETMATKLQMTKYTRKRFRVVEVVPFKRLEVAGAMFKDSLATIFHGSTDGCPCACSGAQRRLRVHACSFVEIGNDYGNL